MAGLAGSQPSNIKSPIPGANDALGVVPQIAPMERAAPLADAPAAPMADPSVPAPPAVDPLQTMLDEHNASADGSDPSSASDPLQALLDEHNASAPEEKSWLKSADDAVSNWADKTGKDMTAHPMQTSLETATDFAHHAVNAVDLGYTPQIVGGVSALAGGDYTSARDEEDARLKAASARSPVASAAGAVTGGIALGIATGGGSEAASVGQAAAQGAKVGALYGLAANTEDEAGVVDAISPKQLGERMVNGVVGGTIGAGLGALLHAGAAGLRKLSNKFADGMAITPEDVPAANPDTPLHAAMPEQGAQAQLEHALDVNAAAERVGTKLRPDEVFPNDPKLQQAHEQALASEKFKEAQLARAAGIRKTVESIKESFQSGTATADSAVDKVAALDRFHGENIGAFRKEVIENAENRNWRVQADASPSDQMDMFPMASKSDLGMQRPQGSVAQRARTAGQFENSQKSIMDSRTDVLQSTRLNNGQQTAFTPNEGTIHMTNLQTTLEDMRKNFGFVPGENGQFEKPSAAEIRSMAKDMNMRPDLVEHFVNRISSFSDRMANADGRMKPREIDNMYNAFKRMANNYAPAAGEPSSMAFKSAVQLKDAFRDDFTAGAKQFINPENSAAYDLHMERYSAVKQFPNGLKKLLATDSPATDDIIAWFDKGGLNNRNQVQSFMKAAELESPEAAEAVRKSYTARLFDKFVETDIERGQRTGGFRWTAMQKSLEHGPAYERLEAVVGKAKAANIADLAKAGTAIEQADKPFQKSAGMLKYAQAILELAKLDPESAHSIISTDHAAQKLLADGAMQKVIGRMSPQQQTTFRSIYNNSLVQAVQASKRQQQ